MQKDFINWSSFSVEMPETEPLKKDYVYELSTILHKVDCDAFVYLCICFSLNSGIEDKTH